ncbi:hypothetical protein M3Y97_01153300 [Aphelenchoides bicaudatus]|nr:hypothetical protein M3Y97_01153300 [Aphelenchoides bicaudatus]
MEVKLLLFSAVLLLQMLVANAENITCKNLVARFKGTFKNINHPDLPLDVDFKVSLSAKDNQKRTYFTMDSWNNDAIKTTAIRFYADDHQHGWTRCNPVNSTDCFMPYANGNAEFTFKLAYYSNGVMQNLFHFLYFENYNNSFTFDAIDGRCTNNVPSNTDDWGADTTRFNACMCCDDYSPDPSLNCPVA